MAERAVIFSKRPATTLYRVNSWGSGEARGQPVVLKVMDTETPGLEQLGRFLHELSVSRALSEAGVRGVRRGYERVRFEGRHALVLQYIEGRELSALPAVTDRARLIACLEVAVQVAHTLGQLHENGVIHCHLKPANVLVSAGGQASLIDLGLASMIDVRAAHLGNPARLEGTLLQE